jgi:hypothetical protein
MEDDGNARTTTTDAKDETISRRRQRDRFVVVLLARLLSARGGSREICARKDENDLSNDSEAIPRQIRREPLLDCEQVSVGFVSA